MIMHEDFTRCECGCALIEKNEYLTAHYDVGLMLLPKTTITQYTCKECKKLIYSTTKHET